MFKRNRSEWDKKKVKLWNCNSQQGNLEYMIGNTSSFLDEKPIIHIPELDDHPQTKTSACDALERAGECECGTQAKLVVYEALLEEHGSHLNLDLDKSS